jgi:hypothetical protein
MVSAAKMNPATEGGEKIPAAAAKHAHRQRASDEREKREKLGCCAPARVPLPAPRPQRSTAPILPPVLDGADHSFILDALYACIDVKWHFVF